MRGRYVWVRRYSCNLLLRAGGHLGVPFHLPHVGGLGLALSATGDAVPQFVVVVHDDLDLGRLSGVRESAIIGCCK